MPQIDGVLMMSILEILSRHIADVCNHGDIECRCGEQCDTPEDHRAHVAQVLEQHERERCYEAWSAGWHDSHYQHTAHNERRGQGHPEVVYSNPYRGRS